MRHVQDPEKTKANFEVEGIREILTGHSLRFFAPSRLIRWNEGLGWLAGGICRRIAHRLGISGGVGWIKAAERACLSLGPEDVDLIFDPLPDCGSTCSHASCNFGNIP